MGSDGNQNPWQTYDTYKDCSQGICSIYCPQWCYIIFPPPPPFTLGDDEDGGSGSDFSPLIIAVIGIVASACILISYYTIISKYCRRRRGHGGDSIEGDEHHQHTNESWQGSNTNTAAAGLDESVIKSITVCIYKKGDGFVDGTDCSVCLTEFQENESLRLLPKCSHAFHLPCIDTWLKSHATCPLCRANIASAPTQQPAPQENQETPASTTTATSVTYVTAQQYQQHRSNDSVLVIQDLERFVQEEAVVNLVHEVDDHHHFNLPKPAVQDLELSESMIGIREDNVNGVQPIRRSVSLNSSMRHNRMSIADILRINEDDHDETRDIEKNKLGILNLVRSPLAMKRSISTGRFMFMTRYENGRSSVILN